jgi:hypothetical protein
MLGISSLNPEWIDAKYRQVAPSTQTAYGILFYDVLGNMAAVLNSSGATVRAEVNVPGRPVGT